MWIMVDSQGAAVPGPEHVEATLSGQGFHIPDVCIKGSEISKRLLLSFRSLGPVIIDAHSGSS